MRPLVLPLAALTLSVALPDAALSAQERRPAPRTETERDRDRERERTREQSRERTRENLRENLRDDDIIFERGRLFESLPGGGTRLRIGGVDDENRAVLGLTLGSSDDRGVRIVGIAQGGPADKAGIAEGDRILQVNETSLTLSREDADDPELRGVGERRLRRVLAAVKPGDEVTLVLSRESGRRTVRVRTVAGSELADAGGTRIFGSAPARSRTFLLPDSAARGAMQGRLRAWRDSMRVQAERRPALGLGLQPSGSVRDTLGLFVGSVTEGGPAEKAGLVEGDRIAAINGVDVRVPRDDVEDGMAGGARASRFTRELRKAKPGDEVRLRVWTEGRYRDVSVKVGRASDVFPDQQDGVLRLDGEDGAFMMPLPPRAPLAPGAPRAPGRVQVYRYPMAPLRPSMPNAPMLRTLPRVPTPPAPPMRARQLRRWSDV
jgi:hypothetical protein